MNLVKKVLSSENIFVPLFVLLLFIPLFFHGPRFGMPYIKGGDEPHYLVIINSLLNDGDLELLNNYGSARKGSWQAGKKFAGSALDPHMVWNVKGHPVLWTDVYEDTNKWKKGDDGRYLPGKKPGETADISGLPAYSSHPSGIAFLLAPFLWLARGTPFTEPLALLCSNLSVILAAFMFRCILGLFTKDNFALNLGTLLTFLGTPLWAYGRTLFMESFLLFFAVGAFYLVLVKRRGFWAGVALGLGGLLKPNFMIFFFPLALFYFRDKKIKSIVMMMIGPALSTVAILYSNALMYGSSFTPPQPYRFGNPFGGCLGLLFSWNHGILPFAPVALLALLLWRRFFREHKREAFLIGGGFILYFLMFACFDCWWGGWCYGPRLVVPALPFLMVPIVYLPERFHMWGKSMRGLTLVLCFLSLGFNLLGAFDGYWDSHPLTILKGNVS